MKKLAILFLWIASLGYSYEFSATDSLIIYQNGNQVAEVDKNSFLKIEFYDGYIVATPEQLEKNQITLYLIDLLEPIIINFKDYSFNSITKAKFLKNKKSFLIEGHINPSLGVLIEYELESKNTRVSFYTLAETDDAGNILFTLDPPHFSSKENKREIKLFINFSKIGSIPYDSYDIINKKNYFLIQGAKRSYKVLKIKNKWKIQKHKP